MNLLRKLKALFRRREAEAEMSEEIRLHLELQTQRNIAAGMNAEEARYAAQRMFGGVEQVKERCREQRSVVWIEQFGRDLCYAAKSLSRVPMFSGVAILTLACAIGANSLVFSLVNGFLLKPVLPVGETPAVHVFSIVKGAARRSQGFTPAEVDLLRANDSIFSSVAGYLPQRTQWGTSPRDLRHGIVGRVSDQFFATCGVQPALGRFFGSDGPAAGLEVVISHDCWQALGGGDEILGRTLILWGAPATVIGVTPASFRGPTPLMPAEIWAPLPRNGPQRAAARDLRLSVIARLTPGLDLAQASARAATLELPLAEADAKAPARQLLLQRSEWFSVPGRPGRMPGLEIASTLFLSLGGVLLLIASLNLANMLLARGATRSHELAVRLALGASRRRVVRLLLCETLLLAVGGSALGLTLASWASIGLRQWTSALAAQRSGFAMSFDFSPDWRVLAATCGYGLLVLLVTGLAPALRSTRLDVVEDLKGARDAKTGRDRIDRMFSLRQLLVTVQIACSFALVVCAGLFLRFVNTSQQIDPGFDVAHNLVFSVDHALSGRDPIWSTLDQNQPRSPELFRQRRNEYQQQMNRHREQMLERVGALPGVRSVALATSVIFPGTDSHVWRLRAAGATDEPAERAPATRVVVAAVSSDYFATLGIPIVAGRVFSAAEEKAGRCVALIDDRTAQQLFPNREPIGERVVFEPSLDGTVGAAYEIVGLVRSPQEGPAEKTPPQRVYRPLSAGTMDLSRLYLHVAVTDPAAAGVVLGAVTRELSDLDSQVPARTALRMSDHIARHPVWGMLHFVASIFGLLGGIGIVIAMVGSYGVKAYTVTRRTREIGVRLALGADPAQLRRMFWCEGAVQTGLALVVGVVFAGLAGLGLSRVFNEVSSFDPFVIAAVLALIGGAALLASWLPARRAAKVDPIVALRCE